MTLQCYCLCVGCQEIKQPHTNGEVNEFHIARNVKCTNVDFKVLMGHCIFNEIPILNKVAVFEVILRHCTVKLIVSQFQ